MVWLKHTRWLYDPRNCLRAPIKNLLSASVRTRHVIFSCEYQCTSLQEHVFIVCDVFLMQIFTSTWIRSMWCISRANTHALRFNTTLITAELSSAIKNNWNPIREVSSKLLHTPRLNNNSRFNQKNVTYSAKSCNSTELALESMKDELSSGTKAQLDCSSYLPSAKIIAGLLFQFVKLGFSCLPSEVQPVVRRLAGGERWGRWYGKD